MPAEIHGRSSGRVAAPGFVNKVIEQEMIGFINLLEALLCRTVTRSNIGVILLGQPAISLFYLCPRSPRAKAEHSKIMRRQQCTLFSLDQGPWRLPFLSFRFIDFPFLEDCPSRLTVPVLATSFANRVCCSEIISGVNQRSESFGCRD